MSIRLRHRGGFWLIQLALLGAAACDRPPPGTDPAAESAPETSDAPVHAASAVVASSASALASASAAPGGSTSAAASAMPAAPSSASTAPPAPAGEEASAPPLPVPPSTPPPPLGPVLPPLLQPATLRPGDACPVPAGLKSWHWERIYRVKGLDEPLIVLTIDGGLHVENFFRTLDMLEDLSLRATMFLMTGPIEKHPRGEELMRRIAEDGHEIANHTKTHPKLTEKSSDDVKAELTEVERYVVETTGRTSRPFLREPYLDRDERTDALARELCYRPVWFTVYTGDDAAGATAESIVHRVLFDDDGDPRELESGTILMFHASQAENLRALPVLVPILRERGFRFSTLGDAVRRAEASGG